MSVLKVVGKSEATCPQCNRNSIRVNSSGEPLCLLCGWAAIAVCSPDRRLDHMPVSDVNVKHVENGTTAMKLTSLAEGNRRQFGDKSKG